MLKCNLKNKFIAVCGVVIVELIIIICLAIAVKTANEVEIIKEVEVPVLVEVTKEIEVTKEVTVPVEVEPTYAYEVSSEEREMLARLVFLEANTESIECQKAIVSTIINRWQYGHWGDTLADVVYAQDQFTPSGQIWKTTPGEINYQAVDEVLKNGVTLPEYVMYFRLDWGFSNVWDGYAEYAKLDSVCFGYFTKDVK